MSAKRRKEKKRERLREETYMCWEQPHIFKNPHVWVCLCIISRRLRQECHLGLSTCFLPAVPSTRLYPVLSTHAAASLYNGNILSPLSCSSSTHNPIIPVWPAQWKPDKIIDIRICLIICTLWESQTFWQDSHNNNSATLSQMFLHIISC